MPTDDKMRLLAELTEAIQLEPHNAECLARRAKCFSDLGEYDKALADANEAIRIDSGLDDAWVIRGRIRLLREDRGIMHLSREEYDAALNDFTEAIRLNPKNRNGWGYRGLIQCYMKHYQGAEHDLTEAIRLVPNHGITYVWRAEANWYLDRPEQAFADFDRAITLLQEKDANPYLVSMTFFQRGYAYFLKGDLARAIEDFTHAIRLDPNSYEAYKSRARAFRTLGDNLNAEQDEGKARELQRQ